MVASRPVQCGLVVEMARKLARVMRPWCNGNTTKNVFRLLSSRNALKDYSHFSRKCGVQLPQVALVVGWFVGGRGVMVAWQIVILSVAVQVRSVTLSTPASSHTTEAGVETF